MIEKMAKAIRSATIIVAPTGVSSRIDASMPNKAHITDRIADDSVTAKKLLNTRILDRAGKMISAETNREPTRFIAITITIAIIVAISMLYKSVLVPLALAKFSSKVRAKILLWNTIKNRITTTAREMASHTSLLDNVRIDVEPNRVEQTSPETLDDTWKTFSSK